MIELNLPLIVQIFVLLNPFASFPFLMSAYKYRMNIKIIAVKAIVVAFLIALVTMFFGPSLFNVFGISVDSFRIAGGIVLLLLAVNMVMASPDEKRQKNGIYSYITIIATPLLTGPATISFITIKAYELGSLLLLINLCTAFILVAMVFIVFSLMIRKINITVIDITSRVLGLFLSAVAIELIAKGIEGLARTLI